MILNAWQRAIARTYDGGDYAYFCDQAEVTREELADWVRELIEVPETEHRRLEAGLSVLGALGPDETAELLRRRLDALERRIADGRAALDAATEVPRVLLCPI